MRTISRLALLVALSSASLRPSPAHADPPAPRPAAVDERPATPPGTWGWILVATSVVAGATVAVGGLAARCSDADGACPKMASELLWGGVGFAALGTALGVTVVQQGRVRVRVVPAPGAVVGAASMPCLLLRVEL